MADALQGKTEIDAVSLEAIAASRVQSVLTDAMVAWPLVEDYSALVGPGMDLIKIPKFSNFTVNSKAENVAEDAQINTFSADSLLLDKHDVVQYLIEDLASLQSSVEQVARFNDQIGRDMAAKMDLRLLTVMDSGVSTSAPDHKIPFADATNEDLEQQDILEARKLLNVQNLPMEDRWGIITPAQEKNLLLISDFVKVNESGSIGALRNGQIGRIYGFDIVVSNQMGTFTNNPVFFGHRSAAAVARQLMPKVEQDRDLPNLADRHSISHVYGVKVLDSGKRYVRIEETP